MLKTNFTFSAVRCGSFHRSISLVKKIKGAGAKRATCRGVLRSTTNKWLKASAAIGAAMLLQLSANAQCNTFQNADAANPLLSVIPAGKKVAGFDFVDIDGDGDMDAYVAFIGGTKMAFFRNVGSATHPKFKAAGNTGFGNLAVAYSLPYLQFADIDGDGDYDFFISTRDEQYLTYPRMVYYENTGTAKAPHFQENDAANPVAFAGLFNSIPFAFADIDGDGDLDFYEDELYSYNTNSYQHVWLNNGTKYKPQYILYSESFNSYLLYSHTYYDWNKDGLLDYFETDNPFGGYYRNIGPKDAPKYINDQLHEPDFHHHSPYRMLDLNNDGAPEMFDYDGSYFVLSPVAVIRDTLIKTGNSLVNMLSSVNQMFGYTYRWEYNDTTIPAATLPYIYATEAGTYTLYVTDPCGTGVSLNYEVKAQSLVAEAANDKMSSLTAFIKSAITVKAFPNPFTNEITVQLGNAAKSTIKVVDVSGKIRLTQTTSAASITIGKTLTAGMYMIQVFQGNEMVYHTTVLKQ